LVLFIVDIYFKRKDIRKLISEKIPFILLSIALAVVSIYSQEENVNYAILKGFNAADRLFMMTYALCFYVFHAFVPINLSALYSLPQKIQGYLPLEYYLSVVPVIILVLIVLRIGVLRREISFGLIFFLAAISLNINIIPFGKAITADRYTYIPYIGIYFLTGQTFFYLSDHFRSIYRQRKKIVMIVASLIVLLFSYLTYQRIGVWKNTLTLFNDASMKAGNSREAAEVLSLGYLLEANAKSSSEKYKEAVELFDKAVALDSTRVNAYYNRGVAKHHMGDYVGAVLDYTKTIELDPLYVKAYPNRASIYLYWQRKQEACADMQKAYKLGMYDIFNRIQVDCSKIEEKSEVK
jgi:tetratricopeptide (TPR) repeat protein